jgi:transcriptional regulator with XRE-family HTH domain
LWQLREKSYNETVKTTHERMKIMNVATANKLVNLRKSFGLSQEGLAAKLGVSRQAVSKWERAESSPDTDNLIALAGIYNMSIDELLDTDIEIAERELEEIKSYKSVDKKQEAWAAVGAMLAVVFFMATGLLFGWWAWGWVVFLLIPIFYYIPILFRRDR